jgi:hypothetical protein
MAMRPDAAESFWQRFWATYRFRRKFGRENWWASFWGAIRATWERSDDEPADDMESFRALIEANARDWIWGWRDKAVAERGEAREILERAGVHVVGLVSQEPRQQPPDCESKLDGLFSGVEVTELVHRQTLERSLKAIKLRKAGKEPIRSEAYFVWDRAALLSRLQALIDRKDQESKRGPYQRYVLMIHTAEVFLDRNTVSSFLEGASFHAKFITDAFLGLFYHPSAEPEDGCRPVFRLPIDRV